MMKFGRKREGVFKIREGEILFCEGELQRASKQVFLNEVKDRNTQRTCIQILRFIQDNIYSKSIKIPK